VVVLQSQANVILSFVDGDRLIEKQIIRIIPSTEFNKSSKQINSKTSGMLQPASSSEK
jgi:hypothetical protein